MEGYADSWGGRASPEPGGHGRTGRPLSGGTFGVAQNVVVQEVEQGADAVIEQQVRQLMELMRQGQPVELPIPRGTVRKTVRLASIAQQFGYEYADSRLGGGYKIVVTLFVVPDPSPQARARAAQNWAQYPNAGDGKSLPPVAPDTLKLLKARITIDLTDKNSEKRLRNAVVGLIVGAGALVARLRTADGTLLVVAGVLWGLMMALAGGGLVVTRRRWAKCTARLAAAGFVPVTVE
ncbi:hypothetical protein C1I97_25375, partial [Streptomyces sp. NTH33]